MLFLLCSRITQFSHHGFHFSIGADKGIDQAVQSLTHSGICLIIIHIDAIFTAEIM